MTTIVLGAGMAGLAAARALADAGREVIVLEARERVGGRVHTRRDIVAGVPVEMGAEFLHGERVPQWELVRKLGLKTLHWTKQEDSLVRTEDGDLLTMRQARAADPDFDITRSWDIPDLKPRPEDEDLYHYLTRLGFTKDQLQYTRRSFANATGENIHSISAAAALQDMHRGTYGEQDWRVLDGYDRLARHLGHGLDVRLQTVVTGVVWGGAGVTVTVQDGRTFAGERVIITLPTGVLGSIAFDPPLPDEKVVAIRDLAMGPGMKIVYVFEKPVLPEGVAALYSRHNPPMWWSPTFGQLNAKQHAITAFATGDWARQLAQLGEEGMVLSGLGTLRKELGDTIPDPIAVHVQNWTDDPFAGGVYSVVSPGALPCRADLAAPTDGKLYWAGEATALGGHAATVHGAYLSGQRAAIEITGGGAH